MRFRHVETDEFFDVHLPRYSLYLMLDDYRYDWTHEILNEEESKKFKITRDRRISIITRVAPPVRDSNFKNGFLDYFRFITYFVSPNRV